jgi:ribosomal protein L25 (general stress protein Ctc)
VKKKHQVHWKEQMFQGKTWENELYGKGKTARPRKEGDEVNASVVLGTERSIPVSLERRAYAKMLVTCSAR